jgi:uncharacterized protein (TIGR04168 family)
MQGADRMRLGVIGDVHLAFDAHDVSSLDGEGYDRLLFVGDLASYTHRRGLSVARAIGTLKTPALVMPGNHDAAHVGQMAAEVLEADSLIPFLGAGQAKRAKELESALAPAELVGFSSHRMSKGSLSIDILAARPHTAGGTHFSFKPWLVERYGVDGFESSAQRMRELVDASTADAIVFFAHNGPTGLGERRDDPWGCDFKQSEGDFGDIDLRHAIDYALERKRVLAVIAGHMHHRLKGGGQRRWLAEQDGVLYVNAARVPRIFRRTGRVLRHHVELVIEKDRAAASERLVEIEQ